MGRKKGNLSTCGVYCIENLINGKKYIGSSQNLTKRRTEQFLDLKHRRQRNKVFINDYHTLGRECFTFSVIAYCDKSFLYDVEQYYLDFYKSYLPEYGYNLSIFAKKSIPTEEGKENIRAHNRIHKVGNKYWVGRKHSIETKQKISHSRIGLPNGMQGRKHTEKSITKMKVTKYLKSLIHLIDGVLS